STGGPALTLPSSLRASYVEQNPKRAYSTQWNVTIQRQVMMSAAMTFGYVGSRGYNLPRSIEDVDQVPLSLVTTSPDGHLVFPTNPAIRNGGPIPRINPNFSRIAATAWDDFAAYHNVVVDFDRRFSRGLFLKNA